MIFFPKTPDRDKAKIWICKLGLKNLFIVMFWTNIVSLLDLIIKSIVMYVLTPDLVNQPLDVFKVDCG